MSDINNLTRETRSEIILPAPVLGEGWSGVGPYQYTPTAAHQPLSYAYNFKIGYAYELTFECTGTALNNSFNIVATVSPLDTQGSDWVSKPLHNDTVVIFPTNTIQYTHLNIVPLDNWSGTVNITKFREILPTESFLSKDFNDIYLGGGGTVSSGRQNTAIGTYALRYNSSGNNNTAIGNLSMIGNTSGEGNTATGRFSLGNNSTGSDNTATGAHALGGNRVGNGNTAIGARSLWQNKTGSQNTAVGAETLYDNTTGSDNIAIGAGSMYLNQTGAYNIALGKDALWSNTTGHSNIAAGYHALHNNEAGRNNIAFGDTALGRSNSGERNIAIGSASLRPNNGSKNIAIGDYSMSMSSGGSENVALGGDTLFKNYTGKMNTAVGDHSMNQNTSGHYNAALGAGALMQNSEGFCNTACGVNAFYLNGTGSQNTAVGYYAGVPSSGFGTSNENSVFIGANSSPTIDSINEIIIGANVRGNGSNTITLGNSDIERLYCNTTAITALSDRRIKEEIEDADLQRCLDTVKKLKVSRYKYKDFVGKHNDKHVTGFLADDVEKVFPKSVSESNKAFPVLDEDGKPVYEIIPETEETKNLPEEARRRPKTFVMEDVKDITMTEAVPTLWGAMQALLEKEEKTSELIQSLLQRENELLQRVKTLEEELASSAK